MCDAVPVAAVTRPSEHRNAPAAPAAATSAAAAGRLINGVSQGQSQAILGLIQRCRNIIEA